MTANELRQKFLDFFKAKGHAIIPSASLIPENDPTVLFTTAGMHPLVPFLLGQKHPAGKRLADVQKCLRTGDIDDIGDNRHLTFFEMLGNWSLGDYFKKEAIEWSWEFLTDKKYLGLEPKRIFVTVFAGDANAPQDQESIDAWKAQFTKAGIKAEICEGNKKIDGNQEYRIFLLPSKDNWWGPAGQTGPCGPCSEMFYDVAPQSGAMKKTFDEEIEAGRIMEIWNDVFMEFNKTAEGQFEKLAQKNVDTGMGVERTVAALGGYDNIYDTEIFSRIIKKIEEISGRSYQEENVVPFRIIADHLKASAFILAEGIEPSNVERGYVLRRLIRRSVRFGKQLGIMDIFTFKIAEVVIDMYKDAYPELRNNEDFVINQMVKEEEKFSRSEERGAKEAEKEISNIEILDGYKGFSIYETHSIVSDEMKGIASGMGKQISPNFDAEFEEAAAKHQALSRAGAEQKFKGGLADNSEQVVKYHTVAHLMLAALRKVLGGHVVQKGANITAERLRFDFSHPLKMKPEELKAVEDLVNEKIKADLRVSVEEMPLEEAKNQNAMGVFEARYGDRVKVYTIQDPSIPDGYCSREICGGPHVERTGVLGKFKITKEESSSSGVRRIKAVLE